MKSKRIAAVFAVWIGLGLAAATWAQEQKKTQDVEGKVRAAGFAYYLATVFGDAEGYLKASRIPLTVIKDGTITQRDEKGARALLAGIGERVRKSGITNDDKGRMAGNMIAIFDDANVQFVGANTAHLTFLIKLGPKAVGDTLGTLILHRDMTGNWRVIGEITDSSPIPPSYLIDLPRP